MCNVTQHYTYKWPEDSADFLQDDGTAIRLTIKKDLVKERGNPLLNNWNILL